MTPPILSVSMYGRAGASTRVRLLDWFEHLGAPYEPFSYLGEASNGLATVVRRPGAILAAERRLRALARDVEARTVLLGRAASPFSNGNIERVLLRSAQRGVYDFDDALFDDTRGVKTRLWSKARVWRSAVTAADVVIAGSEHLADAASVLSNEVVMIPSCVEPSNYIAKGSYELDEHPRGLWVGSPSTESFLSSVEGPLLELHRRRGLRLTVISGARGDLGQLESMIDRVVWAEQTFASHMVQADFGIMPLTDTPFTRGKCAYKLLQYGASALPVVGTPVGANALAIARLSGMAVESADEWISAIEALVDAPTSLRAEIGSKAREAVVKDYSFGAWESTWRSAVGIR